MKTRPISDVAAELAALDAKIQAYLPPQYQHCYGAVSPDSMGSAKLVYGPDGRVAWDEVWTTFCDLALAGGPPHRGTLLEPVLESEIAAEPDKYRAVVAEIARALTATADLPVVEDSHPGWVAVECESPAAAAWLQFAVTAENVSSRRRENFLQLPAGPAFRVEKEIKNLVVALNKSLHYWDGHLSATQQTLAADALWHPASPSEALVNPAAYEASIIATDQALRAADLPLSPSRYTGWIGLETPSDDAAVWLLRAVLADRVLARREANVVYAPVAAALDGDQVERVGQVFVRAVALWKASAAGRGG